MYDLAPESEPIFEGPPQTCTDHESALDFSQSSVLIPPPSIPTQQSQSSTVTLKTSANSSMRLSDASLQPKNSTSDIMEDHLIGCLDPGKIKTNIGEMFNFIATRNKA